MNIEYRVGPRLSVLRKLGLANLVDTEPFDIAAAHEALIRRQAVPERIHTDGLIVDVPGRRLSPAARFEFRVFHSQHQGDEP